MAAVLVAVTESHPKARGTNPHLETRHSPSALPQHSLSPPFRPPYTTAPPSPSPVHRHSVTLVGSRLSTLTTAALGVMCQPCV